MSDISGKRAAVLSNIAAHGSCAIAASCGVDSEVVAVAAFAARGDNARAVPVRGASRAGLPGGRGPA